MDVDIVQFGLEITRMRIENEANEKIKRNVEMKFQEWKTQNIMI